MTATEHPVDLDGLRKRADRCGYLVQWLLMMCSAGGFLLAGIAIAVDAWFALFFAGAWFVGTTILYYWVRRTERYIDAMWICIYLLSILELIWLVVDPMGWLDDLYWKFVSVLWMIWGMRRAREREDLLLRVDAMRHVSKSDTVRLSPRHHSA